MYTETRAALCPSAPLGNMKIWAFLLFNSGTSNPQRFFTPLPPFLFIPYHSAYYAKRHAQTMNYEDLNGRCLLDTTTQLQWGNCVIIIIKKHFQPHITSDIPTQFRQMHKGVGGGYRCRINTLQNKYAGWSKGWCGRQVGLTALILCTKLWV